MTAYDLLLPVHVRIGERREWTIGTVPADHSGHVAPEQLAALFAALADHIQVLVDNEYRKEQATHAPRDN
jgi:hypothetical protein